VATTVSARRKYLISPFTGELASTIHSVGEELYLFVEAGQPCFVSQHGPIDAPLQDMSWIFPATGIILTTKHRLAVAALLLAFCYESIVKQADEFRKYLTEADRKLCVAAISAPHVGHYIWNEISGWPRLFAALPTQKIDFFGYWSHFQMFGGLRELYPQRVKSTPLMEFVNNSDVSAKIFEHRLLLATLKDAHVTHETADRVMAVCRQRVSPDFFATATALRRRSRPLILVTVRLENRSWIEQSEGIPKIMNALRGDFPNIGYILDGLNVDNEVLKSSTHIYMSLEEERALAKSIIDKLDDAVTVFNSIGSSIEESIVLCEFCDAFIAPIGAGMAKYRWIANKPGVAFSNEASRRQPWGTLYNRHRDDPVPSRFVSEDAIRNVESSRHGEAGRANFSMDWRAAYELTKQLLLELFPDDYAARGKQKSL
jgi:hypothetical protein